ncbi:hypothetical protein [Rhodanobacter denitrificans]|uniref:hypothetical protein n=1 Tax=Rhodanobacter denitrificans TaxID=666685 RepID=UPI001F215A66|nr:hypothetical protein [Rhodanobacter denitrificans]UJJ60568.1 hypothetical protein LRK55_19230 [Rhodanobacter denitrificans]
MIISPSRYVALALCAALSYAVSVGAFAQDTTPTVAPLSAQATTSATQSGSSDGDALLAAKPNVGYTEGGEAGTGVANINGTQIDMNRLVPGSSTTDKDYVKKLQDANNHEDLLDLKATYDQQNAISGKGTSVLEQASSTVGASATNNSVTKADVANDGTLTGSLDTLANAQNGNVLGEAFSDCKDTTVVTPVQSEGYITDYKTCEKILTPREQGVVCTRTRVGTVSTPRQPGTKTADLLVEQGATGQVCTRKTTASYYRDTLHQTRDGDLNITTETGGLSCRRIMSASSSSATTTGTAQGDLPISTEMGGLSCTRTISVQGTVSEAYATYFTLSHYQGGPPGQVGLVTNRSVDMSVYNAITNTTPVPAGTVFNRYVLQADPGVSITNVVLRGSVVSWTEKILTQYNNGYFFSLYYNVGSVTASVGDSGNCGDPGSSQCPTKWSCSASAPYVVNGQTVTTALAQSKAPLYPGASSTCVVAALNRTCGGTASMGSSISIGDKVPTGATYGQFVPAGRTSLGEALFNFVLPVAQAGEVSSIRVTNFQWSVTNPQRGVTVSLTQTPTQANGWVAGFSVARTDFSYVPAKPHIVMTWSVTTATTNVSVGDTGNCADTGSTACPTKWTCTQNAPTTLNGLAVSTTLAASKAPLFPGAANTCVVGELNRVCNGSSSIGTSIGIGDLLPAGTTAISAFKWYVTNPDANLSVGLVSAPTLQNGWTATFNVTRKYISGGATPAKPHIHMTWDVLSEQKIATGTVDAGDCNASAESPSCKMVWTCTKKAPGTTDSGVPLTYSDIVNTGRGELYPGEGNTCINAEYGQVCSGTGGKRTSVSIADQVLPITRQLYSFKWVVSLPITGVTVTMVQAPSYANGWIAVFETTRTSWAAEPPGQPKVTLTWDMDGYPVYGFEIKDSGNCSLMGDAFCRVYWTCDTRAPVTVAGGVIPADVVQQQPPLFDGDGGTCMVATLHYDCQGITQTEGTVCWDDDDGTRHCVEAPPPGSGSPDSCEDLENDPTCKLQSTDCADGGRGSNGFCYIETNQYACTKGVPVTDHTVTEVTTCSGNQACLDGSCTSPDKKDEESYSRNKTLATQAKANTVLTDWQYTGTPSAPTSLQSTTTQTTDPSLVPAWANP